MAVQNDTYIEGNVLSFTVVFKTGTNQTLVDPTNVAFGYRINGGPITSFTYGIGVQITRQSTGTYNIKIDTNGKPGTWVWEWQSAGVGQAVSRGALTIIQKSMSLL